ncbi:hypothetical protein AltI4_31040 [Alteromonas sp. I4]|nr:hypothetical protein AltI4_31040 [Alteromonas sp. I4]
MKATMNTSYKKYLKEVEALASAGHSRSDVLKALKSLYLLNDGDLKIDDELGALIADIENFKHEKLFK